MLDLALVPSCNTFESHFGQLGVTPAQLADGAYRGTWITQYAEFLQEQDVRVTLVVPSRSPERVSGAMMDLRLVPVDAAYSRVPERLWRWRLRPVGSAWSSRGLEAHLTDFDVVYLQEYAYGRAGHLGRRLRGRPLIGAHHGASIDEAPAWVRRALTGFTAFSALTATELERLAAVTGPGRAHLLPNWVHDDFFAAASTTPRPRTVVWAGRFDARIKGLHTLLDAMTRLPGTTLELIGTGPDAAEIERRVQADPRLADQVVLTGRLDSRQALVSRVAAADVFVNASRIEGLPIAVLEALAAGRRTVLTDLDYVRAELADAPGLRTAPVGDPAALARAIQAHLEEPQTATQRHAVSEWAQERYSRGTAAAAVLDLLRSVHGVVPA